MRAGPGFGVMLHAESRCVSKTHALATPSLRLIWVMSAAVPSESASTAKLWFWLVISITPDARFFTGWFPPWCPNAILETSAPTASESSWWPRQMPKIGTAPTSSAMLDTAPTTALGSPGPFERNTPSGLLATMSAAGVVEGTTSTDPSVAKWRRIVDLMP